jgi:hypothetical protein
MVTKNLAPQGGEGGGEVREDPAQGEQAAEAQTPGVPVQHSEGEPQGEGLAEQLGVTPDELKDKTRERFQDLLEEKRQLATQVEVMQAMLKGQPQQQEGAPAQQPIPTPQGEWVKAPELDLADDDYLTGAQVKQILASNASNTNEGIAQVAMGILSEIAPHLKPLHEMQVEKDWAAAEEAYLTPLGLSRSDVEAEVNALRQADPKRELRGMVLDAAATKLKSVPKPVQQVPNVQEPGYGRDATPQAPAAEQPKGYNDLLKEVSAGMDSFAARDNIAQAMLANMNRKTRPA